MEKRLTVIQETEILGKKIKMYGSVEFPLFLAKDVAEWIEYSKSNGKYKISQMVNLVDEDEKGIYNVATLGGTQETTFLTEDGLYEVCMQSRKPIAKQMKKEIKSYLRKVRLTGAAIVDEQKMRDYYFSSFSDDLKEKIFHELFEKNKEYEEQLDILMKTEGLMSMNVVAKECGIGLKTLFSFLRDKKVMFYKDNVNIPYQRFMNQELFGVKETICQDGKTHSATYSTKKGLLYIQKMLKKSGYYNVASE